MDVYATPEEQIADEPAQWQRHSITGVMYLVRGDETLGNVRRTAPQLVKEFGRWRLYINHMERIEYYSTRGHAMEVLEKLCKVDS